MCIKSLMKTINKYNEIGFGPFANSSSTAVVRFGN